MKKPLLIFALIAISVVAATVYGYAADKENIVSEQAAKPGQEVNQVTDQTETEEVLNEEEVTPAAQEEVEVTAEEVVQADVSRGSNERTVAEQPVEQPASTSTVVEAPAAQVAVDVPPAQELDIEVPNDWDAYIGGDTAPADEAL